MCEGVCVACVCVCLCVFEGVGVVCVSERERQRERCVCGVRAPAHLLHRATHKAHSGSHVSLPSRICFHDNSRTVDPGRVTGSSFCVQCA